MDINKRRLLYVILFSLVWSLQIIINKYALNIGINPLAFAYQTLFGATLISFTYLLLTKPHELTALKKAAIPRLAAVGILGSNLGTIAMFYGLKYSTSINYGFLVT
ncbi:MAG: EamA family transporter [archaeon]